MKRKILIVDDATIVRKMIISMLNKDKYEFYEASNGYDGINLYNEIKPDLVTLDITMDGLSGMETLKIIKQHDKDANVVMCSAMGQLSFVTECLKLGAKHFLAKPFNKDKIIETVEKFAG